MPCATLGQPLTSLNIKARPSRPLGPTRPGAPEHQDEKLNAPTMARFFTVKGSRNPEL